MGGGSSSSVAPTTLSFTPSQEEEYAFSFFNLRNVHLNDMKQVYDEYKDEEGKYSPLLMFESASSVISQPLGLKMIQLFSNKEISITEVITSSGEVLNEIHEHMLGDSFLEFVANVWFFCTLSKEGLYEAMFDMYDPDKTGRIPANDMVKVLCLVFGDSFPTSAKGVKFLSQVKEVQYKEEIGGMFFIKREDFIYQLSSRDQMFLPVVHIQKAVQSRICGVPTWEELSTFRAKHAVMSTTCVQDFPIVIKAARLPPDQRANVLAGGKKKKKKTGEEERKEEEAALKPDLQRTSLDIDSMRKNIEWASRDAEVRFLLLYEALEATLEPIRREEPSKDSKAYKKLRQDFRRPVKRSQERETWEQATGYLLEANKRSSERVERFHRVRQEYSDTSDLRALQHVQYM